MSAPGGRIDWEEVRRRLQHSQLALEKALEPTADDLAAVYRERAAHLAERQTAASDTSAALRLLVVGLGEERYALEFADVTELLPFVNVTPVPGGPPELLGVLNVHGGVRSILDLGRLLELPDRGGVSGGYILLVSKDERRAALRVDGVENIRRLRVDELIAANADGGLNLRYLRALTPDRVRLLDLRALLTHDVFQPSTV